MSALSRLKKIAGGEFDSEIEQLKKNMSELVNLLRELNDTAKQILRTLEKIEKRIK